MVNPVSIEMEVLPRLNEESEIIEVHSGGDEESAEEEEEQEDPRFKKACHRFILWIMVPLFILMLYLGVTSTYKFISTNWK
uniref:AsIV-cont00098-ORF2 n=1 Tax=Apophua simplicipes ichnovirus TaxID=1329648 RepID=S5DYY4_9VIRU|nr:AsIV-cont00098-ORF2 [Apophua simplicipes ichnovirus]